MSAAVQHATALNVCHVDGRVGYVIEVKDGPPVVAVMTPKQARQFANRTQQAANEATAAVRKRIPA